MPMMPGKAGGAGIGNFNRAKTKPTTAPVIKDNKINFMYVPPRIKKSCQIYLLLIWHLLFNNIPHLTGTISSLK
jgi:hypothetical protein